MSLETDIAAWRDATCETTPKHMWMHAVELAASVKLNAAGKEVLAAMLREPETKARLGLFYRSGEPVWMSTDSLVMMVRDQAKAARYHDPAPTGKALRDLQVRMLLARGKR